MKTLLIRLSLILLLINNIYSLKSEEYVSSILELSQNVTFLQEYMKWSFKLFSQPDYMYGPKPGDFPCQIPSNRERDDPITVHTLRPIDVQCVAGIGDSLTAGLGALAKTPIGLVTENRGLSWSVGGDKSYNEVLTFPNILREYNPNLKGYSTGQDIIFLGGQNAKHNGLNVAKSGDRSYHTIDQAQLLYERFSTNKICNLQDDWKVVTLFVGGNDLCIFCQDLQLHDPTSYTKHIEDTLDFLHANFPRTFVNLVLVLDVRDVEKLNAGGLVCQLMHKKTCPCAAYPSETDAETLAKWIPQYQENLVNLVNSGKYDTRDDFTVVIQPFLARTKLPLDSRGDIDYGYFAPDCFHFSGNGHSRAALSLWNNMLEPIGEKKWEWFVGETIECPTADRPYFATRKNSPQSSEKIPPRK